MLASTLARHSFLRLTTFRKTGEAVPTTVWFAVAGDDAAYFFTGPETGKAKRLRNNPNVEIAPSNPRGEPRGPSQKATARMLRGAETETAHRALARKYGIQWKLLELVARWRGWQHVFYELTAASE